MSDQPPSTPAPEAILAVIAKEIDLDPGAFDLRLALGADLGLDSLDLVRLVMTLEQAFALKIDEKEAAKVRTVDDLLSLVHASPAASQSNAECAR